MKKIKLTQGKYALVDNEDFDFLNQWKWYFDSSNGYTVRNGKRIGKRKDNKKLPKIYMHRIVINAKTGDITDHVNRNKLDNRKSNLRICSMKENLRNSKPYGFSGKKGVSWHKGAKKWRVRTTFNGKEIHLGFYNSLEKAGQKYNEKAKELFGEFAYLN